jgi:hypothetical protein
MATHSRTRAKPRVLRPDAVTDATGTDGESQARQRHGLNPTLTTTSTHAAEPNTQTSRDRQRNEAASRPRKPNSSSQTHFQVSPWEPGNLGTRDGSDPLSGRELSRSLPVSTGAIATIIR